MNERSTDVPAEEQIKSRASLPRALSNVHRRHHHHHHHHHLRRRHRRHRHIYVIVMPLLGVPREKKKTVIASRNIARYYTFPRFPPHSSFLFYSSSSSFSYRQLPVLPSFSRRATPAPPSILSRALPPFSYVSLPWLRVSSPRLIIFALIGSKEFRVG